MRVAIPEFDTKKELFAYLKSNQKDIISEKKRMPIKADNCSYGCTEIKVNDKSKIGKDVVKMTGQDSSLKEGEAAVKVVGNMHGWCDSYMDVLIKGSADKTIKDKGASNKQLLYHLKNHEHTTDGIVGGNVSASVEEMSLKDFNIETDLDTAEALIVSSIVKKKYDSKAYHLYLDDEIKQHSIGLKYIKIYMCVNSDEDEYGFEKENWDKYYKQVINKNKVDDKGFFWAVVEYKLLENSCVLYGANELTPVTEVSKNIEPSDNVKEDTQNIETEAVHNDTSLTQFLTHLTQ